MAARYDRSQLLAHAVIRQCVIDLFARTLPGVSREDQDMERHLAMRFLTATGNDDWARSRRHWCLIADVDPDELRGHIIDILEGNRDITLEENTYRLNGHDIAQALWAKEKARHIAFLDDAREKIAARKAQPEAAQPKPTPERQTALDVQRRTLDALRNGRETVRELGFDVPASNLRVILDRMVERGIVEKDGPRYRLVPDFH